MEFPKMAGAAFLLPRLMNGYGKIEKRLDAIEQRLTRIEWELGIEAGV
jgi:hypothetical protein